MSIPKKQTSKNAKDYTKEYNQVFESIGINPKYLNHEWNSEGDTIKEYNLYEDHPTPVLTPYTHSI